MGQVENIGLLMITFLNTLHWVASACYCQGKLWVCHAILERFIYQYIHNDELSTA